MVSLPFELNAKANFACQVSEQLAFSYYPQNKGFLGKHIDSSFKDQQDTGRKFTCITPVFKHDELKHINIKIYPERKTDNSDDGEGSQGEKGDEGSSE